MSFDAVASRSTGGEDRVKIVHKSRGAIEALLCDRDSRTIFSSGADCTIRVIH